MRTRKAPLLPLIAALLALLGSPAGSAQEAGGQGVERHYWIVMLDVSASFENRAASAGSAAAALSADYRLRNELPSLLRTLLAARNRAEGGKREDFLSVYFFGRGVVPVEEVQGERVEWSDGMDDKNETWWEAQQRALPNGVRARSDLRAALRRAVDDYSNDSIAGWKRHLVVISDGELDVDPTGRDPGRPPAREELTAYDELLTSGSAVMSWLRRNQVTIHALAVDEGWSGQEDDARQRAIRSDLNLDRLKGATPLERARELIEERVNDPTRSYTSEGPLVMQALAEGPGTRDSESRSVRSDNLYQVLWSTFFPTQSGPYVAPGTRMVLVLARVGEPVMLQMDSGAAPVILRYDTATRQTSVANDPRGRVTATARRSAQHVTWVIESRHIVGVQAGPQARVAPVNNVALRWRPGRPPRVTARGQTVPLEAELVWRADVPGDDLATWRQRMRESLGQADATVKVSAPGARDSVVLTLRPELASDSGPVLLRLVGEYPGTQAEGMHELTGVLRLGVGDRRWEELLPGTLLEVSAQPAARPGLFVSAGDEGSRARLLELPGRAELGAGKARPLLLRFTAEPGAPTDSGARAPEAVPDYLVVLGSAGRELGRAAPLSAEETAGGTRFLFSPLDLPDSALGDSLRVRLVAGTATYEYGLSVSRTGGHVLRWLVLAVLVLLALLAVAWLLSRPKPETVRMDDVVVDVNGREVRPSGKLVVLEPLPDNEVRVHARASGAADGVRFAPEAMGYRLAPTGRQTTWLYRRIKAGEFDDESPFVTLGPAGDTLRRGDLLDGWRYQLRHGDRRVEIRHSSQAPVPATQAITRTSAE